jgi:hypothetical protein
MKKEVRRCEVEKRKRLIIRDGGNSTLIIAQIIIRCIMSRLNEGS